MRAFSRPVVLMALTLTSTLISCGGASFGNNFFSGPSDTLTVSPQPQSVAAGSTVTFIATTDAPSNQVDWVLLGYPNPPDAAGTPRSQTGGTTFNYTAPLMPPVYDGPRPTPGTVTLRTVVGLTLVETTFTITTPSITTGFRTPVTTSVALGSTLYINAYALGSVNNAITMQVNGITGGSVSTGTIVPFGNIYGQYQYTAPTAMPMTGSTITITVISDADPTKTSTLTLTLH